MLQLQLLQLVLLLMELLVDVGVVSEVLGVEQRVVVGGVSDLVDDLGIND